MEFLLLLSALMMVAEPALAMDNCEGPLAQSPRPRASAKVRIADSITSMYATVELGAHSKIISRDPVTKRRWMVGYLPRNESRPLGFQSVELMSGASDSAATYFARVSYDQRSAQTSASLYPIEQTAHLSALVDQTVELTWDVYHRLNVVSETEIDQFKATESELPPQRKVNFVTSTVDGQIIAVVRLFDGSPYPGQAMADRPVEFEGPSSDPRLPVERRYPHLNFRLESKYVFESGRFAKAMNVEDVIKYQLANLGRYFMTKFGMFGIAPREYMLNGRNYIEITGQHLEAYLKSCNEGGLGFHLFAMAEGDDKPMRLVSKETTFEGLGRRRRDFSGKFILYKSIIDMVNDHFRSVRTGTPKEVEDIYGR